MIQSFSTKVYELARGNCMWDFTSIWNLGSTAFRGTESREHLRCQYARVCL